MYRLVRFEATNIAGFKSGLGKKTFKLDLTKLLDKDIIVILGDNATGKSTFLSFIHPMHTPSDKKQRFVVEGKEGKIVREYIGDDGTSVITKAIYTPKKDEGHTSKLYFTLVKDEKETELNPNGNVASYYTLVDTYFGVNKEYIQFASYNDVVKGIVKMTDSERKLSVSSLVPNTRRFETAYNIINDKYRDLNNTLRNLSQKIVHLGDEDALKRDLKRYDKEIQENKEERDRLAKKASVLEGRIRELSHGKSVKEMTEEYNFANDQLIALTSRMIQLKKAIYQCCDRLYRKTITEDNLMEVADHQIGRIGHLEVMLRTTQDQIENETEERNRIRVSIAKIENQLNEYEATIFSLQSQSIEDLEALQKNLLQQIHDMSYPKMIDQYQNMSYDEAERFCTDLSTISTQIDIAYERFGELVTKWFRGEILSYENLMRTMQSIKTQLHTDRMLRDQSYQKIMEYNKHSGLKDILAKRPATCTDDSCPFIAKALEWDAISERLKDETVVQETLMKQIDEEEKQLEELQVQMQLYQFMPSIHDMLSRCQNQLMKYLGISVEEITASIITGQFPFASAIDEVKEHMTILSEKTMYDQIVNITLPKIESEIKLVKSAEQNRAFIMNAMTNLKTERDVYKKSMDKLQSSITIASVMAETYRGRLETTNQLNAFVQEYWQLDAESQKLSSAIECSTETVSKILEMSEKMEEANREVHRINREMHELAPVRDQVYYNLLQLNQLNLEKSVVDQNFLIISLLRKIVGPGKGIWKAAIDIYMQDINAIANELLLHMFNGNLSLNDFIIDDKRFVIPYTFNGNESPDISYASSSQQTTISNAISLAIISKLLDRYGILTFDEVDKDLSPINKEIFVKILATQMRYIGIQQCFVITHNPDYYESYYPAYVCFPGGKAPKDADVIYVE